MRTQYNLYHRYSLSFREVEETLAYRGIEVSYETIRQWCQKFGSEFAKKLKKKRGGYGDEWYLNEVFIKINGELLYLWRAVDQDGDECEKLSYFKRPFDERMERGEVCPKIWIGCVKSAKEEV